MSNDVIGCFLNNSKLTKELRRDDIRIGSHCNVKYALNVVNKNTNMTLTFPLYLGAFPYLQSVGHFCFYVEAY